MKMRRPILPACLVLGLAFRLGISASPPDKVPAARIHVQIRAGNLSAFYAPKYRMVDLEGDVLSPITFPVLEVFSSDPRDCTAPLKKR